ncbi:trypsin-like serine peptidase [Pyxidicoccus sp. MSG2]|uniref:trypsin-like serine peptidase n=1 Tax=Pyxidicoccus sp. MSG2 TaxID=2996790 RepID=UPI00226EC539|nr:serine protease [Pyxidicoccus sp. MSG2]MCY1023432.1 serine protease [Pyxidicoccus sp. MSG2]
MRRNTEVLWGLATGVAVGWVVWKLAQAQLPQAPRVDRWTVGTCVALGALAGMLVPFYAFGRDTPAWRRALATRLLIAGGVALAAFGVASANVVPHPGYKERPFPMAVGFGAPLPTCVCPANRADCVEYQSTPENVLACWGETQVYAVSALSATSVSAMAVCAAALVSLLVLARALERTRVLQADVVEPPRVFEKVVRARNPLVDFAEFQRLLAAHSRRVCRIQFGHAPMGTGFLIGRDLVLTNHHVLSAVFSGGVPPAQVRCVFDAIGPESAAAQRSCALATHWDVAHSPPSGVDLLADPKTADPGADELDFAVVRLAEPAGDDTGPAGLRGWVELPDTFFVQQGDPLVILQHPRGQPLHVAVDTEAILAVNRSDNRVRYRTNTEPGSSGSPCFDLSMRTLLALHHSGDPGFRPVYNEGIPIHKIRQRLRAAGIP